MIEKTDTICSLAYDIPNKKIFTLLAFSQGHWELAEQAHGDKRKAQDLEGWGWGGLGSRANILYWGGKEVHALTLIDAIDSCLMGKRAS